MASFTPYFGIAYFDIGDNLADAANVQREMERFVIIDRQLYGLYSIFGSGVIDGWSVVSPDTQDPNNIFVQVEPGIGIVNLMAAETVFTIDVTSIPPNQQIYVFAQVTGQTSVNRSVRMFYSHAEFVNNAVLLAAVVTGDNGVVSIDNSVRREIGFRGIIDDAIKAHHHRGSPSKIDLDLETKGQLSGNKIGEVSANIVTSGVFDIERMGVLEHASLDGIGLFSHPEIDAMLRRITDNPEEERLIEQSIANTLREHIFLKYKDADFGSELLNEIIFVPNVSPDEWIDYEATTANVNLASGCISGYEVMGGEMLSVLWNTKIAFEGAVSKNNVQIGNYGVKLQRGDLQTLQIETFESSVDGQEISTFVASVEAINSTTGVVADASVKVEQDKSGHFNVQQTTRGVFTRTFDTAQNWSDYDRLTLNIKCSTATHGTVQMYLESEAGVQSSTIQLLSANEITTNVDQTMMGFEERTMVLTSFSGLAAVKKLVIVVNDVDNAYGFWVDDIKLRKTQDYEAQGSFRLRYSSAETVNFTSLIYTTTLPAGTNVKARIRVATNESDLDSALFSPYLLSADQFTYTGKWAEIDVQLYADVDQLYTPIVSSVELGLLADAASSGFTVDDEADWAKGTSSNITFVNDNGDAQIRTPITVGDIVYLNDDTVNEIDADKQAVFGINNQKLPLSEQQAFDSISDSNITPSLSNARSVVRTNDRRYIVADTENHRIVIFDQQGVVLKVYAGANTDTDTSSTSFVKALTATYNEDTGVLWIGFSKTTALSATAFDKIVINIGATRITLGEEGQILAPTGTISGRIIPVLLTEEHQSLLNGTSDSVNMLIDTGFGDYATSFDLTNEETIIKVYFAPISYHDYIYYPVYASENSIGNLWICNATKLPLSDEGTEPETPVTRNLQEFNPDEDTGNYTNTIYFMKEYGGMVAEDADGNMYAACVDSSRNGKIVANPLGGTGVTVYNAPDSNYPTHLSFATDDSIWVAESSAVDRGGRVLQIDRTGSILTSLGDVYTQVYSIQVLEDGNLLIAT